MKQENHQAFMNAALALATEAGCSGEVPIGAVIVCNNHIIASTANSVETDHNPLSHAEMKAIELATQIKKNWRLSDCSLYVTLEPCPMCLGALFQARVGCLYFGCSDPKRTSANTSVFSTLKGRTTLKDNNHNIKITGGILEGECAALLKDFFRKTRNYSK